MAISTYIAGPSKGYGWVVAVPDRKLPYGIVLFEIGFMTTPVIGLFAFRVEMPSGVISSGIG